MSECYKCGDQWTHENKIETPLLCPKCSFAASEPPVALQRLVKRRMTQQQIDEWNEIFPVGSPCWVTHDDGSEHTHNTRSKAYECPCVNKGHVVVKVDGLSYSVDLNRVRMAETHELKPHNK